MRPIASTLIAVTILGVSTCAHADDLQAIDAIAYYGQQCNAKGKTAYFSNNHGNRWEVIQTAAYVMLRKQTLDMTSLNAMLNGVDGKQVEAYLANNRPTIIQNMQQQRMLTCQ